MSNATPGMGTELLSIHLLMPGSQNAIPTEKGGEFHKWSPLRVSRISLFLPVKPLLGFHPALTIATPVAESVLIFFLLVKVEMHLDLQLDRNRLAVQGGGLIFPLQHRLQSSLYKKRVSAHSPRLDDIPLFIDDRVNDDGSLDVCLPGQWRIFRIYVKGLARRSKQRASAHDSLCRL